VRARSGLGGLILSSPTEPLSKGMGEDLPVDRCRGLERVEDPPLVARPTIGTLHVDRQTAGLGDVDAGREKRLTDHLGTVRPVPAQRLARPLPRHQDPATTATEMLTIVRLRRTRSRRHAGLGTLGLDPEPQPVPTPRRAGQEPNLRVQPVQADPDCEQVSLRDAEEQQPITIVARIKTSLRAFQPLFDQANAEIRLQRAPLYNSVYRFDDEMFVTPHLFATPGHSSPLLHLRRLGPNGVFARFASHFDQLWSHCAPVGQDQRESSRQLS
jgi:hypothetical protein